MITKLAHQFSGYLVENGADESKKDVYAYSMEFILNLMISDILLLITGLLFHQLPALIIWCISYTALRMNVGGFHASSHIRCIILGTILGISCLLQNWLWLTFPILIPVMFILILLNIIIFAPAVYEKHPVSDRGKKKAKIRSALIFLAGILFTALLYEPYLSLSCSIVSGFVSATLLSIILTISNNNIMKNKEQTT